MFKSKLIKAFILGLCLTIVTSGTAFANTGSGVSGSPNEVVSSPVQTAINKEILQKQSEVDRYLFEQNKEEIARRGITVTHTAPIDNHVEIGITPYNEENANYLYGIFGKDLVKVVEGQQAVTLNAAAGSPDDAVSSPAQSETAASSAALTDTAVNAAKAESNTANYSNSFPWIYIFGGVILMGGTVVLARRLKAAGR